jgi:hypothetical protein
VAGESDSKSREGDPGESCSIGHPDVCNVLFLPDQNLLPRAMYAAGQVLVEPTGEGEHPSLDQLGEAYKMQSTGGSWTQRYVRV